MGRVEELQAELRVVELEEQLKEAKGNEDGPDAELKLELREARREFREARAASLAGGPAEEGE